MLLFHGVISVIFYWSITLVSDVSPNIPVERKDWFQRKRNRNIIQEQLDLKHWFLGKREPHSRHRWDLFWQTHMRFIGSPLIYCCAGDEEMSRVIHCSYGFGTHLMKLHTLPISLSQETNLFNISIVSLKQKLNGKQMCLSDFCPNEKTPAISHVSQAEIWIMSKKVQSLPLNVRDLKTNLIKWSIIHI